MDGIQLVEVILYADSQDVHECLKTMVLEKTFAPFRDVAMSRFVARSSSPLTSLYCRRYNRIKSRQYRPGWEKKEPDGRWAVPPPQTWTVQPGVPLQRINPQSSVLPAQDCAGAALEVIWHNETADAGCFEGLLWSGVGRVPNQPVQTTWNAIILVCVDAEEYTRVVTGGRAAFLVMTFDRADETGNGTIKARFINAAEAWVLRWQAVFDDYKDSLWEPVSVDRFAESVSLPLGFFGPKGLPASESWQNEVMLITEGDLQNAYHTGKVWELSLGKKLAGT